MSHYSMSWHGEKKVFKTSPESRKDFIGESWRERLDHVNKEARPVTAPYAR